MGGLAFATGPEPLYTPRMPNNIYHETKQKCIELLREHFSKVESPIDGPGKTDFGDVDIYLYGPKEPREERRDMINHLQDILGASRVIAERGTEVSGHFAIPWPANDQPPPPAAANDESTTTQERHIQVDLRIFTDLTRLRWMLCKHAHGDIWNLIGTTVRPYGLTIDDTALWLRVPEIEELDKKQAKIFLSSEPDEALSFLDLQPSRFWEGPFDSAHDMFEYVAQCRMFWVKPVATPEEARPQPDCQAEDQPNKKQQRPKHQENLPPPASAEYKSSDDRRRLKANDRRRMVHRPLFRYWVDEFLPECRSKGRFRYPKTSRDAVTREAFDRFGPQVEADFVARRKEFLLERDRLLVWTETIKKSVPQPEAPNTEYYDKDPAYLRALQYRGTLVKALKKIILEGDDSYGVVLPDDLQDQDGFFDHDKVRGFIEEYGPEVGRVAFERQHAAYLEKKARDEQKRSEKAEQ